MKELKTQKFRVGLWNCVLSRLFSKVHFNHHGNATQEYHIFVTLWKKFFHSSMDEFERHIPTRKEWYLDAISEMTESQIFLFLEFVAEKMIPSDSVEWRKSLNEVFKENSLPIRMIGTKIVVCGLSELAQLQDWFSESMNLYDFDQVESNVGSALQYLMISQWEAEKFAEISELQFRNFLLRAICALRNYLGEKFYLQKKERFEKMILEIENSTLTCRSEYAYLYSQAISFANFAILSASEMGVEMSRKELEVENVEFNVWGEKKN